MAAATKTPAEIPAETNAAQRTEFDPMVPIGEIAAHPRNIRHDAAADAELIESIRSNGLLQPLVVMPYADTSFDDPVPPETRYVLVAGHRRIDGLRKAGYTYAPAIIRHDLNDAGDQVAAMLVENGRRADLTPLEEAEGFDLLTEFGWTVDRIAEASGRSKNLVKERRKLTGLTPKVKDVVDTGQITIDDALKIARLPKAEQAHMEKYADKSDFRYELARVETRVKAMRDCELEAKELRAAGARELTNLPKNISTEWYLNHADHGAVALARTGRRDPAEHPDCFAFAIGGTRQYPQVWKLCTNPAAHDEDLDADARARKAQDDADRADYEKLRAEQAREREAERIAARLRATVAVTATRGAAIPPALVDVLRMAVPWLLYEAPGDLALLSDLLGLEGADRIQHWDDWRAYTGRLMESTPAQLVTAVTAAAAARIEETLSDAARFGGDAEEDQIKLAMTWFDWLTEAGHERNSADDTFLAAIVSGTAETDEEDDD